jgi:hypothetical protein
MNSRQMARTLGARGGRARALRLTADRRRRIASLGGAARRESLAAARRIVDNFAYLEAVVTLQGGRPEVRRVSDVAGRLPGLYPGRPRS